MKKITTVILLGIFAASVSAQTINTYAGTGTNGYSGDGGQATAAKISIPIDVATDDSGNVYIADLLNSRIRKVSALTGIITTVAGTGAGGYSGDGGQATAAQINEPAGLVVDTGFNLYIADYQNNRVRKVTHRTGIITTIAGTGTNGYNADGIAATAAELSYPEDVSNDDSSNIYIADTYNYRIRKICIKTGIITTIAGNGTNGYSGDGGAATAAEIGHTEKIRAFGKGSVYIGDENNNRIRLADVSTGLVTTFAGTGVASYTGSGLATASPIYGPEGITLDAAGNVYFVDINDSHTAMVDISSGLLSTVAGTGSFGFSGDGGPAVAADLSSPTGVASDKNGNLYIADQTNYRVRIVNPIVTGVPGTNSHGDVSIYPVPNDGHMTVQLNNGEFQAVRIFDELGGEVYYSALNFAQKNSTISIDMSNKPNGVYFVQFTSPKGITCKRVVIIR